MKTKTKRRGFTLIEMVLVIGATSIILGLCAGTIHALLGVHRSSRAHLSETTTVGRLALQFRQDARAATSAKAIDEAEKSAAGLELTLPEGQTVVYRSHEGGLARTQGRAGEVGRRDLYSLPRRGVPRFEVSDDRGTELAILVLTRRAGESKIGESIRELRIEGHVGRDDRLRKGGRSTR